MFLLRYERGLSLFLIAFVSLLVANVCGTSITIPSQLPILNVNVTYYFPSPLSPKVDQQSGAQKRSNPPPSLLQNRRFFLSLVIMSVFFSVEYLIFTLCRLTKNGGCEYLWDVNSFLKYGLFLLCTSIRADIAVQGPLVSLKSTY